MKVGIDAHFLSKLSQGTGTYTYQLINAINAINRNDEIFLLNKNDITSSPLMQNGKVIQGCLLSNYTPFNVICGYSYIASRLGLDVIHTNYLSSIIPVRAKQIVTVHDILFKTHSEYFPNKLQFGVNALTNCSLRNVDHIIAVSNYTKRQLINYYPFVKDKVSVIYEAASPKFCVLDEEKKIEDKLNIKYHIHKPYVLFVGRLAPIKNIEQLIRTFIEHNLCKHYNLVVVGNYDKSFPNEHLKEDLRSEGIIHLTGISDDELNGLYNAASFLYFVSHGEGFGLPILEAMSTGCPVLTSNDTACAEVAGNAALKVSPDNGKEISEAILTLLDNDSLREELSNEGIKRSKDFSWEKCAKQTLELYHQVVK